MRQRGHSWAMLGTTGSYARPDFGGDEDDAPPAEADPARDFCELVDPSDPDAANDDCFAKPDGYPNIRGSVAASLIRGLLWWAVLVSAGFAAFAAILR